ncbi:MAG TPA: hypothetical protein VF595_07495 [Tepidisphaeraceae bacterium]|jgi:hypothetical protein
MHKMKSAALAVLLASCGLVRADVLDKLPADALVAGKVANLTATSNKIAKLAKDLGIDAFVAPLQNPLAAFKQQSRMEKGINDSGEIGFAYLDPKTSPDLTPDDSFVIVIPVSSYADFLSNFGDAKTEAGVSEVTTPDGGGKPMFLADWGDGYAALSPAKALVNKPSTRLKVTDAAAKEAGRQDFLVVANFEQLGQKLMPELDKAVGEATKEIDNLGSDKIDPKYKPLMKVAANQLFAAGKTFLNSTNAATIGLNISDAGINSTVLSNFRPDSYLGQTSTKIKGTDKPLTIGLPAMRYLAYGGSTMDPAVAGKLFSDIAGPVLAELNKIEGIEGAKKLVASATATIGKNTGSVFAAPAPTKIGQEGIIQQLTLYRGGAAEMKTLFTDGGTFAKQFIADMKLPPDRPKPMLEIVQNEKSIEGVSFDSIKFEAKQNPDAPGAAQQEAIQNLMYGSSGMNYSYGTMGDDFLLVSGATDEAISAFIKSVKAGEDNVSKLEPVKAVAAELPKTRVLEYYLALDELVNTGVAAAAQFNLPVQVQLPPELPPFGLTFGAEGASMRLDTHLPTTTVQSLIAAGMQAFMGMQQGGGNL